jgi:hypothetical protein
MFDPVADVESRTAPLQSARRVRRLAAMPVWFAISALLMAASPASSPSSGGAACPKVCERKAVPCSDKRQDGQMMCVEIVKRCELRCDARPDDAKRAGRRAASER